MPGPTSVDWEKWFSVCRISPLLVPLALTPDPAIVFQDLERWLEILNRKPQNGSAGKVELLALLSEFREFRTLYYYRLSYRSRSAARWCSVLKWCWPGQTACFLWSSDIGPGLFLQHAFSTAVGAERIGKNCWINQEVSIGFRDATGAPILGDNVTVNAGAKVLGRIRVGNNVTIGANAVVVKDVPDDCVVVGVPAYIVRRKGIRVHEKLGNDGDPDLLTP